MLHHSIAALSAGLGVTGALSHAPMGAKLLLASFVIVSIAAIAIDRVERPGRGDPRGGGAH